METKIEKQPAVINEELEAELKIPQAKKYMHHRNSEEQAELIKRINKTESKKETIAFKWDPFKQKMKKEKIDYQGIIEQQFNNIPANLKGDKE